MTASRPARRWLIAVAAAVLTAMPASAAAQQTVAASDGKSGPDPVAAAAFQPQWIATLGSGVIDRDGDAARPYVVAGLSRKIGRGYVRVAATGFRSSLRQVDAALPSSFAILSLGAGGTFGRWFVDGYASAGHQFYGGVTTPLGTRASRAGNGSGVYGAALTGGRFVRLSRRWFLTPSLTAQYSTDRALRSSLTPAGPSDYQTAETAITGSGTVRIDRFFGSADQHLVGLSLSRVQTSNGSTVLSAGPGAGPAAIAAPAAIADGWFVVGPSASIRLSRRLWLDGSASRTVSARSGDYSLGLIGLRLGW